MLSLLDKKGVQWRGGGVEQLDLLAGTETR